MKTAIIIVNYNTPWHLNECLKSLFKFTQDFHLFLVNNAPEKESLELSEKYKNQYPEQITVINNSKNKGFVGGVNSAYELAKNFERVCFVNSDIIVTEGWLKELSSVLDNNPEVVQVAPDLNHYYEDKFIFKLIKNKLAKISPELAGALYKLSLNFNPPRASEQSGFSVAKDFYLFCTGACNLARMQPFIKRGYFFDPNIIHGYGDDFDTSYYLREFGQIGATNKAYVFHFLNTSFNKLKGDRASLKEKLQLLNHLYVLDKWKVRLEKDISEFSKEKLLEIIGISQIDVILKYLALSNIKPELSDYIKTIPAREIGIRLGIDLT